ncbi:MAG: hypothetical protein ACOYVJ_06635 [Nitrospirota bacterium]
MSDGRGILWKNRFVWSGRSAFRIKHYIDKMMVRKYQVSGEADEV